MSDPRAFTLAALAASLAAAALAAGSQPPPMHSTAFDWQSVAARPTKVGEVRRFFDAATPTLERLELHVTTLRPGESSHPPHRHPEEELIIVKEGTVESLVNGQTQRLGPGSVIFQASNELHAIRNVGEGLATYHVMLWRSAATPPRQP